MDGFNRMDLCEELGIDWTTSLIDIAFQAENEVLDWIEANARGRRSQTKTERNYYIGCRYLREKNENGGDRGNQHTGGKGKSVPSDSDSTADLIAQQEGCSDRHVKNCAKRAELINEVAERFPYLKWPILSEQIAFTPKWASAILASSTVVISTTVDGTGSWGCLTTRTQPSACSGASASFVVGDDKTQSRGRPTTCGTIVAPRGEFCGW